MATKYRITVDLPTAKKYVEVSGLGLFENHTTTELTDEQVELWFLRPRSAGAEPLTYFQDGITIEEFKPSVAKETTTNKEPTPPETRSSEPPSDTGTGDTTDSGEGDDE